MSERTANAPRRHHGPHDWHSRAYVDDWIGRDVTRDAERRPLLQRMLAHAPLEPDLRPRVLDVGGGYGVVTEETLRRFPGAKVTLLDYSEPMLAHARARLKGFASQVEFVKADLTDPRWPARVKAPFDLAVSAIALHNLGGRALIAASYRAIAGVLRPGGAFLDCDLVSFSGGLKGHLGWMREAGFAPVTCPWEQSPLAIMVGIKAA